MRKTITYDPVNGVSLPDSDMLELSREFMSGQLPEVVTSNSLFIDFCRALIAEDMNDANTLTIIYDDRRYEVSRFGALPPNFPDVYQHPALRILSASMEKRRRLNI